MERRSTRQETEQHYDKPMEAVLPLLAQLQFFLAHLSDLPNSDLLLDHSWQPTKLQWLDQELDTSPELWLLKQRD
jgi:hypothetical protein